MGYVADHLTTPGNIVVDGHPDATMRRVFVDGDEIARVETHADDPSCGGKYTITARQGF